VCNPEIEGEDPDGSGECPESVRRGTPKISVKNYKIIPKKQEKNPGNSGGLRGVLVGGCKKWPVYDCTKSVHLYIRCLLHGKVNGGWRKGLDFLPPPP
jgi:hypothetical protein